MIHDGSVAQREDALKHWVDEQYQVVVRNPSDPSADAFWSSLTALARGYFLHFRVPIEDCFDLAQEAATRIFKGQPDMDKARMSTYLYTVCQHLSYDFFKNQKKVEDVNRPLNSESRVEVTINPPTELRIMIRDLIAGPLFTEDERLLFKLRYFEGHPFSEIARLLNKKESTVRGDHHRALRKFTKAGFSRKIF